MTLSRDAAESVFNDLAAENETAEVADTIDLLLLAGFVLHEEQETMRIYKHHATGERVYVYTGYTFVPARQGQAIALIIANYWP